VRKENDAMRAYIMSLFNDGNESDKKVRINATHNTATSVSTVSFTNVGAPSTLQSIL